MSQLRVRIVIRDVEKTRAKLQRQLRQLDELAPTPSVREPDGVDFFEWVAKVPQVRGPNVGQPLELKPWQVDWLQQLLYTKKEDGRRQYREAGLWIPRKNGKTMLSSMIAAWHFANELKAGGQIILTASIAKQAGILFDNVVAILRAVYPNRFAPPMKRYRVRKMMRELEDNATGAKLFVLSGDGNAAHGYDASVVVTDEVHSLGRKFGMVDALRTCFGAQSEPLWITITTAGVWDTESVEWKFYQYACKVRDGVIDDPGYLPTIYEADVEDDWLDRDVWAKANPALGDFRSLEDFERLAARAKAEPSFRNEFRRLYLNQHTASRTAWLDREQWEASERSEVEFEGDTYGGLDLSTKRDVTAFSLVGANADGGLSTKVWLWIPEATALEHERTDKVPYLQWRDMGWVEFTPGSRVNQKYITQRILEICEEHQCYSVDADPWNAEAMIQELGEVGLDVTPVAQTTRHQNEACNELDALLADGVFRFEKNDCLSWMASNTELDAPNKNGHRRPIKPKQGSQRIDGITAMVIAINGYICSNDTADYESGGCIL